MASPRVTMSGKRVRRGPAVVRVGCSGWQYRHWRGDFYPADLPVARWFEHYTTQFDTVEINNTFYRLPEPETFAAWRERAPRRFLYAVKASRYLTHMKKLNAPQEPLQLFFSRALLLGPVLGPVLYQLPPHWPVNIERFAAFLAALPATRQHVVEFRDPTWYNDRIYELMSRHGVGLCLHDMPGSVPPERRITGPLSYIRFHGPERYAGRYPEQSLAAWSDWCRATSAAGYPVYVYFNNDIGGHAPRDAVRFRALVER